MYADFFAFVQIDSHISCYPDDLYIDFVRDAIRYSKWPIQVITHRDGDLMYYACIKRLGDSSKTKNYIGFCSIINGVLLLEVESLFAMMNYAISKFTGNIGKNGFSSCQNELEKLRLHLAKSVEFLNISNLPNIDISEEIYSNDIMPKVDEFIAYTARSKYVAVRMDDIRMQMIISMKNSDLQTQHESLEKNYQILNNEYSKLKEDYYKQIAKNEELRQEIEKVRSQKRIPSNIEKKQGIEGEEKRKRKFPKIIRKNNLND